MTETRRILRAIHACDERLLKLQDEYDDIVRDEPTWTTELEAIREEMESEKRTLLQLRDELAAADKAGEYRAVIEMAGKVAA